MTTLPPLPFSYQTTAAPGAHEGNGHVYLLDRNGRKIASVWGTPDEKLAIVQMIIDESERLAERRRAHVVSALAGANG